MKTDPLKDYKTRKRIEEAQSLQMSLSYERAEALYQEVLKDDPESVDAMRGLGILGLQQARADEGVQWLKRALVASPDSTQLWNDLGEAFRTQGLYADAILAYEKALSFAPGSVQVLNNLGAALMLAGDYERSEKLLREALDVDGDDPFVHNTLGVLLEQRKLYEQALLEYEAAVCLKPDFEEARANYSDLLARNLELIGDSVERLRRELGLGEV